MRRLEFLAAVGTGFLFPSVMIKTENDLIVPDKKLITGAGQGVDMLIPWDDKFLRLRDVHVTKINLEAEFPPLLALADGGYLSPPGAGPVFRQATIETFFEAAETITKNGRVFK